MSVTEVETEAVVTQSVDEITSQTSDNSESPIVSEVDLKSDNADVEADQSADNDTAQAADSDTIQPPEQTTVQTPTRSNNRNPRRNNQQRNTGYVPEHVTLRRKLAQQSTMNSSGQMGPYVKYDLPIKSESMRLLLANSLQEWMEAVADTVPMFNYIQRHEPSAKLLNDFLIELKTSSTNEVTEQSEALDIFIESHPDCQERLQLIEIPENGEVAELVFQQPHFWSIIDLIKKYDNELCRVECLRMIGIIDEELEQYRKSMINKTRATVQAFTGITRLRNNRRQRTANTPPLDPQRFERLKQRYYREMNIAQETA